MVFLQSLGLGCPAEQEVGPALVKVKGENVSPLAKLARV
jgi:hypothetical protein